MINRLNRSGIDLRQRFIHEKYLAIDQGNAKPFKACRVQRQISLCALGILEAIDTAGLVGLLVLCPDFLTTGVRFELSAPTRFLDQKNGA